MSSRFQLSLKPRTRCSIEFLIRWIRVIRLSAVAWRAKGGGQSLDFFRLPSVALAKEGGEPLDFGVFMRFCLSILLVVSLLGFSVCGSEGGGVHGATLVVAERSGVLKLSVRPKSEVDFGALGVSSKRTLKLQVVNESGVDVEFSPWRSPCDCLTLGKLPLELPAGGKTAVSLTLRGEGYIGKFRKSLFVRCRSQESGLTGMGFVPVAFEVVDGDPPPPVKLADTGLTEKVVSLDLDDPVAVAVLAEGAEDRAWLFGGRDCPICNYLKRRVLPRLFIGDRRSGRIVTVDLNVQANIILLLDLEKRLGIMKTGKAPILYRRGRLYYGAAMIKRVADKSRLGPPLPGEGAKDASGVMRGALRTALSDSGAGSEVLDGRVSRLTLTAVVLGGLTDGVNPCVFTGLIFFISLLSVSGIKGRRMLMAGAAYCAACFITYVALGFGILGALRWIGDFSTGRFILNSVMTAVLVVLSVLSFADAWRFKRGGKASDIKLKLPESVTRLTRSITRRGVRSEWLFLGAFAAGALVTFLEALCTGQVYVPVLAMVARSGGAGSLRSALLLLLYNAAFMVPLLLVFLLAMRGVSSARLAEWSRRNAVAGKIAMGAFFALLAILMTIL